MKKGGKKSFSEIWDVIDVSVFILVIYSLLELIFSISTYVGKIFPVWILSYGIIIFAFGLIGYKSVKQKLTNSEIAKYGAYAGLITGFAGAIISIISFYVFPERFVAVIQQAVQQGADSATVQTFMKIGLYVGLIITPAIYAGIGALVSWISGMIFRKK